MAIGTGDHLYLIDGSGYIFRAYHALPPLSRKSDGMPTGAVSGFSNMLHKLLRETRQGEKPTHLAVIFDKSEETFRKQIYPQYKANRTAPPDDLILQFAFIRDAVRAFNVACIEKAGFEADDIIATWACEAMKQGAKVTIVSSDKDLMQLVVDGKIEMLDPVKNRRIGSAEVIEKFGVPPEKVIDVQALIGDSVDNVPGVPGIGVKTAAELIQAYGDLDTLLARASEIKQPKRRETLIENSERARLSRALVTLDKKVKLDETLDDLKVQQPEPLRLIAFLKALEFMSLVRRVASEYGVEDVDAIEPEAKTAAPVVTRTSEREGAREREPSKSAGGAVGAVKNRDALTQPFRFENYATITDVTTLEQWVEHAIDQGEVAIVAEGTTADPMTSEIVGISLALGPNQAAYIPIAHRANGLALSDTAIEQLPLKTVLGRLKAMFEDGGVLKIGHDLKYTMLLLLNYGIRLRPIDDAMLISYVLDCGRAEQDRASLAETNLGHKPIPFGEVTGTGKGKVSFENVPIGRATAYAGEQADIALRLQRLLKPRLAAERMTSVYEYLERPLVTVLADMERAGILIDRSVLSRLSGNFAQRMLALEDEIYKIAGTSFNLGSPKQLGEILFERLKLPQTRSTRTGASSTDADTLEELAAMGHDMPRLILDWRQLSKLKGTYTDALPGYVNPKTGRVHTNFALASTSTGRLSSLDPNLQNIPIRTEEGRQIRQAFVADKGKMLVSADYSQIELRLLAHIADIPQLKKAFADGTDIHAMTASEMFGVPVKGMPVDVRRRAKAINFGIIYGISAFGLANQLGIARGEADSYIKKYFERFPGIRDYMERTKTAAHRDGFVRTCFGRKVHIPEINSRIPARRSFSERAAINAPIQGSAADIIRRAMVRIPEALGAKNLSAQMLLQVHDELVFEVPESEVEETRVVVKRVMEGAALPALELSVPLTVDAKPGRNWDEAH